MGKLVATVFFVMLIAQLYRMTRDEGVRTSRALWLPTFWFFIGLTRNVTDWLQLYSSHGNSESGQYMEGSPVDRAILTLALALGVMVVLGRGKRAGVLLRQNLPILLYFSYCLVSILWSDFPDIAFKRWFRALGDVAMVLIVLTELDWVAAIKRVFIRLGVALVPLSILFSRWYPQFGREFGRDGTIYLSGVTGEKNALGMLTVIFGLSFLYYFLQTYREEKSSRRRSLLIAYAIIASMSIYLLIISRSATSLATLFLAGIPMILTDRYKAMRQPVLVHAMVLGALGVAVSALFLDTGSGMLTEMGRNATLTGRTAIWHAALSLSVNPLFGTGFESFWLGRRYDTMADLTGQYLNQSHNGYLEIYLNLGWVGIGFLALVLITGYQRIVKAIHVMAPLASLRLALFIFAVSENFTEATFKTMNPPWVALLLAAMAITEIKTNDEVTPAKPERETDLVRPKSLPSRSKVLVGSRFSSSDERMPLTRGRKMSLPDR
jgi:exopolysaccharide production protein ExoQ